MVVGILMRQFHLHAVIVFAITYRAEHAVVYRLPLLEHRHQSICQRQYVAIIGL